MSDIRGIKERLRAGAEAERLLSELSECLDTYSFVVQQAKVSAADYRAKCQKELPEDLVYAGDPLSQCTAIDSLFEICEIVVLKVSKENSNG